MKTAKRTLSILLAMLMLASCLAIGTSADSSNVLSKPEWDAYWETVAGNNTLPLLTPGADATKLNFCWHSNNNAHTGSVRISKSADMKSFKEFTDKSIVDSYTGQRVHKVTVTGLEPNTVYYYTYGSNGIFSQPASYRTLSTEKFKMLYVSDIQISSDEENGREEAYVWQKTLGTALDNNNDISFIISAGDQTQHGDSADEWVGVLAPEAMRSYAMATTVGNHDRKGDTYPYYVNNPNEYYGTTPANVDENYWFRYGDVLFIVYNTQIYNVYDQYQFTLDAVANNEDATWRVAVLHHDIYGTGHHAADDDNKLLAAIYSALIDRFEIDVCLTGHEHLYGRSYFMKDTKPVKDQTYNSDGAVVDPEGTVYFTASSASGKNREEDYDYDWLEFKYVSTEPSYSTVEFTRNTFTLETYGVDSGQKIDECKIVKTDTSYTPVDPDYKGMDTNMLQRYMGKWYVIIQVAVELLRYAIKITAILAPVVSEILVRIFEAIIPMIISAL